TAIGTEQDIAVTITSKRFSQFMKLLNQVQTAVASAAYDTFGAERGKQLWNEIYQANLGYYAGQSTIVPETITGSTDVLFSFTVCDADNASSATRKIDKFHADCEGRRSASAYA